MRIAGKVAERQAEALDSAEAMGLSASARRRLSAAQAVQVFAHRIGSELAAAIPGLTEDEIHDWGNASRDRRGPHWKLVELVERAIAEGVARKRALVLVDWIESQLGRVAFDQPRSAGAFDAADLRRGITEAGEALAALVSPASGCSSSHAEIDAALSQLRDLRAFCDEAMAKLCSACRSKAGR